MQHHPLPEYPRPALRRDSYENLNGLWQYAITGSAGLPAKWDGDILVPYSPETKASGVERTLQPGAWLHYHRSFVPPAGTGGRVLLHFGAVDYACAVQVNGHLVGGHRGGYWPEGLYTPPSDGAVVRELQTIKELGFNLLRKHAKIEPQRWYYHCDKLGLIVWQDMVNGGGPYKLWFVTYLTNVFQPLLRRLPDARPLWGLLGRETEAGREEYAQELEATVKALQCHPCVGCWVPFNEGWGQFDAAGAVEAVRRLDDTRLVDEASGWYDQGGGDVESLHNYFYPLRVRPRSRVVALSEYGGIAWPMPGHEPPRRAYGYGTAKSRAELTARWKKLQLETVLPQLKKGLSALVYTQVSDVEDEVNGLFTYDRAAIKPDPAAVRAVNEALEAAFEKATE